MAWNSPSLVKNCSTKKLSLPDSTSQMCKENCCWLSDFVFFVNYFDVEMDLLSKDFKTLVTTSAFLAATLITGYLDCTMHSSLHVRNSMSGLPFTWYLWSLYFSLSLSFSTFFKFFFPSGVNHWTDLVKSLSIWGNWEWNRVHETCS